jgi:hypothetical protein
MDGVEDTGEHLLRLRTARRAIAAADFAGDHRGPERVFGAPVGGVDHVGLEQEGEHGRKLDGEMRGEIARDASGARAIDEGIELIVEMPPSDGQAMGRHCATPMAIPGRERALQDALDARREMVLTVIADEEATPPEQMGETRLMNGLIEPAIGRPAIAHDRAGEVGAQDRRGFLEAAPRQNRVDGRVRRGEGPQPVQVAPDFPAGFIRTDDIALTDLCTQGVVGGTRAIGRAMQRVDQPAGGDVQPKSIAKEGADFGERQSELCMQDRGERHRLGAQLRRGGAQRIGRLQRMPALHPTPTRAAVTDLDGERAHDRADDRKIFLVLPCGPRVTQSPATMRARVRQRRPMVLGDVARNRAVGFASIRSTGAPAGSPRGPRRGPTRERGRLPIHLTARVVQLVFEPVDFLAEGVALLPVPIPIAIRPFVLAAEPLDLALLPQQLRDQFLAGCGEPPRLHATVMPRLRTQYKRERVNAARRRPPLQSVTR